MKVKRKEIVLLALLCGFTAVLGGIIFLAMVDKTTALPAISPIDYSTFLGGDVEEDGRSIVVDDDGYIYVTGFSSSNQFPLTETNKLSAAAHGLDVYVAKFNPDASALVYVYWFNGISALDPDEGYSIGVDSTGAAYVTGATNSADFCSMFGVVPGYETNYLGNGDAFLLKVKPDGSGLDYCTYLGGSDLEIGTVVAVGADDTVYVAGGSWSTDLMTATLGYTQSHSGARDLFLLRLDASGEQLLYSSYLGGSGQERPLGMVVAGESVYLTGWTNSADFPIMTGAVMSSYGGGFDGYLVQLDTSSNELLYSSYLGGSGEDRTTGLFRGAGGKTAVVGYTLSADLPVTAAALQPLLGGGYDGFLLQLDVDLQTIEYGTYWGGTLDDFIWDVAGDRLGALYLAGESYSADLPGVENSYQAAGDGILLQFNPQTNEIHFGQFVGGADTDRILALFVGEPGEIYITGKSRSTDFPVTAGSYNENHSGDYDIFVTHLHGAKMEQLYLPQVERP